MTRILLKSIESYSGYLKRKASKIQYRSLQTPIVLFGISYRQDPHYGGLWEAAVRSMKLHLKRIIGEACLTVAELSTVLTQVEVIKLKTSHSKWFKSYNSRYKARYFFIGENLQAYPKKYTWCSYKQIFKITAHWADIKQHFFLVSMVKRILVHVPTEKQVESGFKELWSKIISYNKR